MKQILVALLLITPAISQAFADGLQSVDRICADEAAAIAAGGLKGTLRLRLERNGKAVTSKSVPFQLFFRGLNAQCREFYNGIDISPNCLELPLTKEVVLFAGNSRYFGKTAGDYDGPFYEPTLVYETCALKDSPKRLKGPWRTHEVAVRFSEAEFGLLIEQELNGFSFQSDSDKPIVELFSVKWGVLPFTAEGINRTVGTARYQELGHTVILESVQITGVN
jgi:hypothetical protein